MKILDHLQYTKTHEWARADEGTVVVGITDYAQQELKDVVYIELPRAGQVVEAGQPCAVIESVKAAFDIYAPVSGTIVRVNDALTDAPQLVNEDCYGEGWMFVVRATDTNGMLTAAEYAGLLAANAH